LQLPENKKVSEMPIKKPIVRMMKDDLRFKVFIE
jgi:hypothetical protein